MRWVRCSAHAAHSTIHTPPCNGVRRLTDNPFPPSFLALPCARLAQLKDGFLGKSDPYCRVSCPAFTVTTEIVKNNLNPTWDQGILVCLPPQLPPTLNLTVFDSDKGVVVDGSDDFLGSAELDLSAALSGSGWNQVELPLT